MKKTIAVGSASLLGLAGVGAGVAPAQAADPECTDVYDHNLGTTSTDWYMDCLPLYGIGEVGFTITSAEPFPEDFVPLDDQAVVATSTTGAAGQAYVNHTGDIEGLPNLFLDSSTATSQTYRGDLILNIASRQAISPVDLPDGCTLSYTSAYKITYLPTTVTFTQQVNGVEWRYDVVAAPGPLYLGFNIVGDDVIGKTFDSAAPMCLSSDSWTWDAASSADFEWIESSVNATGEGNRASLTPYFGDGKSLPDVARYVPPVPVADPPAPQLAATGSDYTAGLGLAAMFLALGVAGGYLSRRRARAGE